MPLTVYKQPNQFNQVRQTIPFLVYSNLFDTLGFDAIERSFKYLFEVRTLRSDGVYRTFSTVAIPPRPSDLLGLFDASALVKSAISYDLGTHLLQKATPCPKSIIEFMVICTERYLDGNGNYVSGTPLVIGSNYYAIDAGVNESLNQYLMDYNVIASPLHHHFLLGGQDLKVYAREPMSISWLLKPKTGGNVLTAANGNFGSFDKGVYPTDFATGLTVNSTVVLSSSLSGTYAFPSTGNSLQVNIRSTAFGAFTTSATIWSMINIPVGSNKTYVATYRVRTSAPLGAVATQLIRRFSINPSGPKLNGIISTVTQPIYQAGFDFVEVSVKFTTNSTANPLTLQATVAASALSQLQILNGKSIWYDSVKVYEIDTSNDTLASGRIVVNDGLNSEISHTLPAGYFTDLLPIDNYSKGRFDAPVGPYNNILADPTKQDANTGFYLDDDGNIGKHFQLELFDSSSQLIGRTSKIYQDQEDCSRYKKLRLKFKNKLGGFDFFDFELVSSASTNVERENFKITSGQVTHQPNTNNYLYTEANSERGYKNLNIKLIDTFTMTSNWITDQTAKFLQGLFVSDEIYLLNPEIFEDFTVNDQFDIEYPVFLNDTDIEYKTNSPEKKLVNITINVTPGNRFGDATTNI
jgi:hypothetical protein